MRRAIILLCSVFLLLACAGGDETSRAALAAVERGALLVDVRSAEEYAGGHLPGSINIPHGEIVAGINALEADATADIVLYCRSGNRSGIAASSLTQAGFSRVMNAGAYSALKPLWDRRGQL